VPSSGWLPTRREGSDPPECDHVHFADGISDDRKGILSHLTIRGDVVRRVDVAIIDLVSRNELIDLDAEQIRTLSWAEYDTSGSVVRSGEGGGRWGSVMPDTLGEVLEHDACGNNEQISTQVAMPAAPNPPTSSRPNKKTEPVPRWGMQLTADYSESKAWATYRLIQKQYAALIGDLKPIVIRSRGIGLGITMRYNIRIVDDDRAYLEKLCQKLIAAGGACVVLENDRR
jgi:hypothetical protein